MTGRIIEAEGPEGRLFACVDPSARYCAGMVCRARFAANLAPYTDESAALAAIEAAGGKLEGGKQ